MLNINVAELRNATEAAIARGKELHAAGEEAARVRKALEDAETRAQAERILAGVANACREAAEKGLNRARIMAESSRFSSSFRAGRWHATITGGVGVIVCDALYNAGLAPEVVYEDDGGGMRSWAVVYATWK